MPEYVHPNCAAVVLHKGGRVRLNPADTWDKEDPFVKARPDLFSADPIVVAHSTGFDPAAVERATRAPGEKRMTRQRPAKEAAAVKDTAKVDDES